MPIPVWNAKPGTVPGEVISDRESTAGGVLKDFWGFILHPRSEKPGCSWPVRILNLVKLYFFALLMMIPLGIMVLVVCHALGISGPDLELPSSFSTVLILIGIMSVLEEMIFRLPLRYTPQNLAVAVGTIALLTGGNWLGRLELPAMGFWAGIIGIAVGTGGLIFVILRQPKVYRLVNGFYQKRFAFLLHGATLLFGLLHIVNYDYRPGLWLFALVLTAPQIFGGLVLSYLRIRQGFFWSTIYHICWNYFFIISLYGSAGIALGFLGLLFIAGIGSKIAIKYGSIPGIGGDPSGSGEEKTLDAKS